ncbi:MAG: hypothetical protein IJS40_04180, partial [Synergistaceae bacterium]|nr:hypothetical protein [Synergistaceae bacterium]
ICRENLFNLWDEFYSAIAPSSSDSVRDSARFILEKNIICGDSINGTDKIIFSEWIFLDDKINVQRSDFNFRNMLEDSMYANIPLKDFDPIDYRRLRDSESNL